MSPFAVWALLAAITFLEVGLAWVRTAPQLMLALLLALSLGKAALIAWYFMHLRPGRRRPLAYCLSMLFACVLFLLALLPDGVRAGVLR